MLYIRRLLSLSSVAVAIVVALALASGSPRSTEAAVTAFDAGMSGVWENPSVTSPGFGMAHFTFDDSTRVLTYAVTISGLSPDQVTAAHIHRGPAGTNGPVIYTLASTGFTQISGQITLTDADVADLKAGNLYVNAHSVANPGGFARGQMHLDPAESIADTFRLAVAAYNAQDINRLALFFTDAGFQKTFDATKAEARAHPDQIFQGPVSFRSITGVRTDGLNAAADVELGIGAPGTSQAIQREHDEFILDAGLWRLSDSEQRGTPLPSGARVTNVSLVNFAFVYDKSLAVSSTAFHFTNNGTQEHEAVLVRLNTDKSLDAVANDLLQGGPDAPPPSYANFVFGDEAPPGGEFNLVLTQPLSAGRYAFFCFFPDVTTGQPHVALGMRSEFTVVASGAGGTGVLPPNTGDAGLERSGSGLGFIWIGVALLALACLSGGALEFERRRA